LTNSFDLIVLGAGSGGLAAAKRAASYGAKVAIIEGDRVGGTCVIRGCVPKKLLLYGSLYKEYIENASGFGVAFKDAWIDPEILLSNVRSEVNRLNLLHIGLLKKCGVELLTGWASFIDCHTLLVKKNSNDKEVRKITGSKILIAVGGEPNRPDIPGSDLGWLSDDVFLQSRFPDNVLVIGAGFIACEFSCILNGLGVKVKQLVRGDQLLKGFDKDLSEVLIKNMKNNGIELEFGQYPVSIKGKPGNLSINTNLSSINNSGGVLFAIGRSPRLKGLNLSAAGVISGDNRVLVDEDNKTNISNIYAVGDVTNRINLTPVAVDEGRAFADTYYGNNPRKVNYEFVPRAVFSQPEIASVGLTEEEAIKFYGQKNIKTFRSSFRSMSTALPKRGAPCLLKLITKGNSQQVIGCHMVGEHASEIIQMGAISLSMGALKSDFDKTMALHPTIAEEFVTMS